MRDRRFVLAALAVALLVAGGLSLLASSSPDGLEKVADDTGFADTAVDGATAGSPLADYQAGFVDGPFGQTLAGVIGVLITLALFYGLVRLLRRREPTR